MTGIVAPIVSVVAMRPGADGPEVLLLRRVHPPVGAWCQVAGKVEPGETAWAAALRELREETGLVPKRFWSADVLEQFYEARRDAIVMAPVFLAEVGEGAEPTLDPEHDAHRWLAFGAAADAVSFPGQRRMLREIEDTFVRRAPHPDLLIVP
ncbi:NUDIX domain-containing protein [Jannaschia sp. Os4]|uniref:NUDIX hydrolase n=1 Tax=Jannaschia sp. Os4 TaxID=2807617 RepID=UPI00193A1B75|nr:NUDIX domain-containing protein [Jannaschia sp. Os4]MBM2577209.1 NUDIX domain-containing protein [Jannaschia sp. Os4]